MTQAPQSSGGGKIRISRSELESAHVDDMLQRHANLRGETGMGHGGKRKWFLQNWFLFSLAGAMAALAGWALLEPFYNDLLYHSGSVDAVDLSTAGQRDVPIDPQTVLELNYPLAGTVVVDGRPVHVIDQTQVLGQGGATGRQLQLQSLQEGQPIGFYVEYYPMPGGQDLLLGVFAEQPPTRPPAATPNLATQQAQTEAAGLLLFPVIAGLIGMAIGIVDGLICRQFRRMLIGGLVGLVAGFIGGFLSGIIAGLVYTPINELATRQAGGGYGSLTTFGFILQMMGRGLAWAIAGIAMGIGQGLALRSKRLLLYGVLGGVVGGLLGGLLFDPVDLIFVGEAKPSAHIARLVGLLVIGAMVGFMIGIVELLARDAWLRMLEGPLAGKEFLIFRDTMVLGASPRCEIYLFNDDSVLKEHAVLRAVGDNYEIESRDSRQPVLVNGQSVPRRRLRHGDQITIGRTVFAFQKKGAGG